MRRRQRHRKTHQKTLHVFFFEIPNLAFQVILWIPLTIITPAAPLTPCDHVWLIFLSHAQNTLSGLSVDLHDGQMRYRCFLDTHYHCYWCDYLDLTIVDGFFYVMLFNYWSVLMIFQRIFMVSGWFSCLFIGISLVFRVFHFFKFTIFNYATICWTIRADVFAMFSRFIDHHMELFPMVTNHQSRDAMYRSNLFVTLQAKEIIFLSNPGEWFSKFTMSFCWW